MSFALINLSCFGASMTNSPNFWPGYKYYNKWLSLVGALMCVAVMFLINWWATLITIMVVIGLCAYVRIKKPNVNWGTSEPATIYNNSLKSALKLVNVNDHVKNFRPQILLLSGNPKTRENLVDFAATITKKQSLLICGNVLQGDIETRITRLRSMEVYTMFAKRKVSSFYNLVCAQTFRIGVQVLLQTSGIGKLRPNILMLGYKCDWLTANPAEVLDYFNVIEDAFDLSYGVGIVRVSGGFDNRKHFTKKNSTVEFNANDSDDEEMVDCKEEAADEPTPLTNCMFRDKHRGTIDVWWLYDDGGLTMLIPYILRMRKQWRKCRLRVFCLLNEEHNEEKQSRNSMETLLSKFRIEYSELTVLTDVNKKPLLSTYQEFENILIDWRQKPDEMQKDFPWKISETDLIENKQKTYRHLRLREMLIEHSRSASLIVMKSESICDDGHIKFH